MIIECKSLQEAELFIDKIKEEYNNVILNFNINTLLEKIYLIIDGDIQKISNEFLKEIGAKQVFSSLDEELFFISKKLQNNIKIGNRNYFNGDNYITIIAGPCEVENYESLYETAKLLKEAGVSIFRAMPEKPRTSPYNFQGVGKIGWNYLRRIKEELNLPILAEVFCKEDIELAIKYKIDIIQIGARNMQNYNLIKEAAKSGITTVLKKGMWCNNMQFLKAAEYFFVYGKGNVILCERGIQTHENLTRNTFDVSSILYLKEKTNLPVMADASHGTGVKKYVSPVNEIAVYLGADVIEVEVHKSPDTTIKPGDFYQMLNIEEYKSMLNNIRKILKINNKKFDFEV